MNRNLDRLAGAVAGVLCVIAGIYLLLSRGEGDALLDPLMTGVGIYFIAKGVYVWRALERAAS
jgi:hypothetical protein